MDYTQPHTQDFVDSTTTSSDTEPKVCCDYYQEGLDKLNAPIILASVRAGYNLYDGKPFVYCPWCGKKTKKPQMNEA